MSYILDALRKADAQRERDPARGIHAQSLQAQQPQGPAATGAKTWVWAGAAAGVVVVGGALWYALQQRGPAARAQEAVARAPASLPPIAATPVAASAIVPSAAPAALEVQAGTEAAPTIAPRRATRLAQASPAQPVVAPAIPPASVAASMSPLAAGQPPMPVPQAVSPAPGAPGMVNQPPPGMTPPPSFNTAPAPTPLAPRPPVSVAPAPPTPPVAGLPAEAPKLTITGGVYSANRAQRMLIVNGQVAAEGADLGNGVKLEEIQPKAAVLTFRGSRYVVGY